MGRIAGRARRCARGQREAEHHVEAEDVGQRQDAEHDVVAADCAARRAACSMLASKLPWVSIAAFGEPAVPLVNSSAATAPGSSSVMPSGSPSR